MVNERIAVLIAFDEEAKRVPTDNGSHCSSHKGRATFLTETSHLACLTSPSFHLNLLCDVSNLFHHRPLSAPKHPVADLGRRQGKGLKKDVLGTRLGDVIGKLVTTQCPKVMNAWKERNCEMGKASKRPLF